MQLHFSYHVPNVKRNVATPLFLPDLRICDSTWMERNWATRHVLDVAFPRASRTFYDDSSPEETRHLSYTEDINSLHRLLHLLSCRLVFRKVRRQLFHALVYESRFSKMKIIKKMAVVPNPISFRREENKDICKMNLKFYRRCSK